MSDRMSPPLRALLLRYSFAAHTCLRNSSLLTTGSLTLTLADDFDSFDVEQSLSGL